MLVNLHVCLILTQRNHIFFSLEIWIFAQLRKMLRNYIFSCFFLVYQNEAANLNCFIDRYRKICFPMMLLLLLWRWFLIISVYLCRYAFSIWFCERLTLSVCSITEPWMQINKLVNTTWLIFKSILFLGVMLLIHILMFVILTEDDTSVATEVKVPILMSFHRHVYDREWHFSCESSDFKRSSSIKTLLILFVLSPPRTVTQKSKLKRKKRRSKILYRFL